MLTRPTTTRGNGISPQALRKMNRPPKLAPELAAEPPASLPAEDTAVAEDGPPRTIAEAGGARRTRPSADRARGRYRRMSRILSQVEAETRSARGTGAQGRVDPVEGGRRRHRSRPRVGRGGSRPGEARENAFRDDLAQVVRPRRPVMPQISGPNARARRRSSRGLAACGSPP